MNALRIQQGNTIETVSLDIIKKLYNAAVSVSEPLEGENDDAYLSGHISVPNTYEEYVNYLAGTIGEGNNGIVTSVRQNAEGRFQNLRIDVTNGYLIPFEDPNMLSYLLSLGIGSNNAITTTQAAAATVVANSTNTVITKFNELRYFTNITESRGGFYGHDSGKCRFTGWTALEEIDISNFTTLGHDGGSGWDDTFAGCTSLKKVTSSSNLTKIGFNGFQNCGSLQSISNTSNVTFFGNNCFYRCTSLQHLDISNAVTIRPSAFQKCSNIAEFSTISCPNLTGQLSHAVFAECTQIVDVTDLGSITELGDLNSDWDPFYGCTNLETVVVPSTVTSILRFLRNASNVRWVKLLCDSVPTTTLTRYENFGESWNPYRDRTGIYEGLTYPIYVKDSLYNSYISDGALFQALAGVGRIKRLSEFATDFPNG